MTHENMKSNIVCFSVASVISLTAISLQLRRRKHRRWLSKIEPETNEYFSHTFNEARLKFRNACSKIPNCKTHAIMINKLDDITIDMCYIPCTQKNDLQHLFIHSSGIHGVEGYAGSAIQCKILTQIANGNISIINPQSHYLFIHAINGYGMKHNRRFNQFNIDLNRNCFLNAKKWTQMKSRPETLVGYHIIDPYINLSRVPIYPWDDIWLMFKLIYLVLFKFGSLAMLGRALVTGQYHKAIGVFYGGFQLQKELKSVISFIVKDCETIWNVKLRDLICSENSDGKVHKLTMVDVHTGLGPKGIDTLLSPYVLHLKKCGKLLGEEYAANPQRMQANDDPRKKSIKIMYTYCDGNFLKGLLKAILNPERLLNENVYESDDEKKEEMENKSMKRFVNKAVKYSEKELDIICTAQEFGTVPSILVGNAVVLENMALQNCNVSKERDCSILDYRQNVLRGVFYLENDVWWKYKVLQAGVCVFSALSNR